MPSSGHKAWPAWWPLVGLLLRGCASSRGNCRRRRVVRAVDLIEGAAPGLEPERPEPDHAEYIPRGEVAQRRAEHHEVGRGGLDQIAPAHDQRPPHPAAGPAPITHPIPSAP